ncbi:MAG TPA: TIGR03435 family protein [Acidobacteriaceae bacterium]|nr:TIGR03435 family protein [Acidobacteriaceae bacterium]
MKTRKFAACHSEPHAKNSRIFPFKPSPIRAQLIARFLRDEWDRAASPRAALSCAAAKRRSRGTFVFVFVLLSALCTSSAQIPAAQSNALASANTAQPTKPFAFEIVSIRPHKPGRDGLYPFYLPDGFQMTSTFSSFISLAYTPKSGYAGSRSAVKAAPEWAFTDLYDIEARVGQEDLAAWQRDHNIAHSELFSLGLQAALRDRAKLAVHTTTVEQPCLNLLVAKRAPKLEPTVPGAVKPISGKTYKLGDGFYIQDDRKRQFVGVSMEDLVLLLTRLNNGHLVQDRTGLTRRYDFSLPLDNSPDAEGSSTIPLDRMPVTSIGLTLKPGTAPFLNIYIDHIERPDAN